MNTPEEAHEYFCNASDKLEKFLLKAWRAEFKSMVGKKIITISRYSSFDTAMENWIAVRIARIKKELEVLEANASQPPAVDEPQQGQMTFF
jgi:hypothetical protein